VNSTQIHSYHINFKNAIYKSVCDTINYRVFTYNYPYSFIQTILFYTLSNILYVFFLPKRFYFHSISDMSFFQLNHNTNSTVKNNHLYQRHLENFSSALHMNTILPLQYFLLSSLKNLRISVNCT
jgi:hypothetical protein